jgi:hypothetical protein
MMETDNSCGSSCSIYTVAVYDISQFGPPSQILYANTSDCRFNEAYPAVFEGYDFGNCDELPPHTDFANTALYTGPQYSLQSQYNPIAYNPTVEIRIGNQSPSCGWGINNLVSENETTLFQ